MKTIKVIFQPEGKTVHTHAGITIAALAAQNGIKIDVPCGAVGKCGKCKVTVLDGRGVSPVDHEELDLLSGEELKNFVRLSCRARITGEAVISVPRSSRLQTQKILDVGIQTRTGIEPAVKKQYFKEPPENLKFSFKHAEKIEKFRNVTAVIDVLANELITLEAGDTTGVLFGMAFDAGTTTVVGTLVDLKTGLVVATAADMNAQVVYGDDVISRLNFCIENKNGLLELNDKIIGVMNRLLFEVCKEAKITPGNIYDAVICGNTTMEHFLLKVDARPLGIYPFVSSLGRSFNLVTAGTFGFKIGPGVKLTVFPVIGGWVGGDTLGVILATSIYKTAHIKLAIDIGTNGEVVLGNKDRLVAASCAAGPAFEGAHIRSGMRASRGAIEKIDLLDGKIVFKTIEDSAPAGFCGSGLIDAMALLVEQGIVDETGRIKDPEELPAGLPAEIKAGIVKHGNGNEFIFVRQNGAAGNISLTQKDVREIQLAKGAMLAGIIILMKELKVEVSDIKEVLIAGAFGNYIRADKALAIGLIPPVELKRIIFCGNAAEEGARKALVSLEMRKDVEKIAKAAKYVDLSSSPVFQDVFAEAMMFPVKDNNG